jgi:hypothetical protein
MMDFPLHFLTHILAAPEVPDPLGFRVTRNLTLTELPVSLFHPFRFAPIYPLQKIAKNDNTNPHLPKMRHFRQY